MRQIAFVCTYSGVHCRLGSRRAVAAAIPIAIVWLSGTSNNAASRTHTRAEFFSGVLALEIPYLLPPRRTC